MLTDASQYQNMSIPLLPHRRQRGFYAIDRAEEIGFDLLSGKGLCTGRGGELFDCADQG